MKNWTLRIAGTAILFALTAISGLSQSTYTPYTFTTLAGGGGINIPDVPGTAARFSGSTGVAVDPQQTRKGQILYLSRVNLWR